MFCFQRMSIHPNVAEKHNIELAELADQLKEQRAIKTKMKF